MCAEAGGDGGDDDEKVGGGGSSSLGGGDGQEKVGFDKGVSIAPSQYTERSPKAPTHATIQEGITQKMVFPMAHPCNY